MGLRDEFSGKPRWSLARWNGGWWMVDGGGRAVQQDEVGEGRLVEQRVKTWTASPLSFRQRRLLRASNQ